MNAEPVWITGLGLVTALGATVAETWPRLARGDRGIGPVSLFDTTGQRATLAAEARSIGLAPEKVSRSTLMALSAAREAIDHAKLDVRGRRVGLVVAGTTGGMFETETFLATYHADPTLRDVLAQMLTHPLSSTSDRMEMELGPFARVRTISSACSGGASALIVAASWLLSGEVDAVLAGGTDGLCRLTFTGFNALGAIDPEPCRPFDKNRRGLTLGEGAGFVVLERRSSARGRPIAELSGWAMGAEAHHITNPEATGKVPARLIFHAIARAGLAASQIDYVSAHGTGTPLNDAMESQALARALGPDVARVLVSSSKGQLGHTLGAAGAIEAIVSALAIEKQFVPPTVGLRDVDPNCALVHVPDVGRAARVRAVVSNSFGFGGMDAVLVLSEPELARPRASVTRNVVVTGAARFSPAPGETRIDLETQHTLDPARARRFDRLAKMGTAVAETAHREALAIGTIPNAERTGVVLGNAIASVAGSAAYMHRIFEKGARLASPADFPNLVPSSPIGHASIYMGLSGPAFAVVDLTASADSAVHQGIELISSGEADTMITGGIEETSDIVDRVLGALFRDTPDARPRSEGASSVVLEAEETARARGAKIIARVLSVVAWRDGARPSIPAPRDAKNAHVFAAREAGLSHALEGTGWESCPRTTCEGWAGEHEGLGGIAIAEAVRALADGTAREVLVMGVAKKRGHAFVLGAP